MKQKYILFTIDFLDITSDIAGQYSGYGFVQNVLEDFNIECKFQKAITH